MAAPPPPALSFRFDDQPLGAAPPEAALELTASDGTGLRLVSLTARIVVDDPLSFTELALVFENPEDRRLEGRFRITLPGGASVSRFAMRQGDRWQEGEVVERQAARRAYEDFLHRAQDPALLEHESGNEFSARVFPIEPRGRKELLLSYGHELTRPGEPYRLPLRGLPRLDQLELRALVGQAKGAEVASSLGGEARGYQIVEVRKSGWKPDADFEVRAPSREGREGGEGREGEWGLRCQNLVLARVFPDLPSSPDEIGSLLVLLDASASRSLGHARQIELLSSIARALAHGAGPEVPLLVASFDQAVSVAFEGRAGDFGEAEAKRLGERPALGATDLGAALSWAASRGGRRFQRALLISDGVSTAGETEPEKLALAARSLAGAGVERLDALAAGGLRDEASLRRLVTAGLARDGVVCDADLPPGVIGEKLTRSTRSGIKVSVPGASWVWPQRLDGVQAGDAVLVYADLPEGSEAQVLLDGSTRGPLSFAPCERPLLERAWIRARIERLEALRAAPETDPDVRAGLKKQIVELSVQHRVLCPHTALLVLETEADYARHNIDRRALADILTVGMGGLEVLRRSASSPAPPAPEPAKPRAPEAKTAARKELAKKAVSAEPRLEAAVSAPMESEEEAEYEEDEASDLLASDAPAMPATMDAMDDLDLGGAPPPAPAAAAPMREMPPVTAARIAAPMAAPMAPPPPAPMPSPGFAPSQAMPSPARSAPAAPSPLRRLASAVSEAVSDLFSPSPAQPEPPPAAAAPPPGVPAPPRPEAAPRPAAPPTPPAQPDRPAPWTGRFLEVMQSLLRGNTREALSLATLWLSQSPGDVLALVALATAAEAAGDLELASRACGAIVDLFPSRADLRRFAGERLEKLGRRDALELAIDTYRKALESRADHPSSHRLLGMALLRAGRAAEAFEVIARAQARSFDAKFPGIPRILTEDLALCGAAWARAEPAKRAEIERRVLAAGAQLESAPSVRFVLVWETDANDVDFHIHDAQGGHAYYASKVLPSGGELYADVTQGYGPECFTIRGAPSRRAYPYRLEAHYFRRGPMGYGMGTLQILEHDGKGGVAFEDRPYIVMQDQATVDLGVVTGPLAIEG